MASNFVAYPSPWPDDTVSYTRHITGKMFDCLLIPDGPLSVKTMRSANLRRVHYYFSTFFRNTRNFSHPKLAVGRRSFTFALVDNGFCGHVSP